jgi:hypothetical protein
MQWGRLYEKVGCLLYERKYKVTLGELGCLRHKLLKKLGASPDGVVIGGLPYMYNRLVEIKCPTSRKPTSSVPPMYEMQMQVQMSVTGFKVCDYIEVVIEELHNTTYDSVAHGKDYGWICYSDCGNIHSPLGMSSTQYHKWHSVHRDSEISAYRVKYWNVIHVNYRPEVELIIMNATHSFTSALSDSIDHINAQVHSMRRDRRLRRKCVIASSSN